MSLTKVAAFSVVAAMTWAACSGDPVRHTPDGSPMVDGAIDAPPPDAPANPAMLSGSPGDSDFGDVVLGQTTSKVTYTITNDGDEASGTVGVIVDPTTSGFAVSDNSCSGVTLAKHATCTFAVAFTPGAAGVSTATLHIAATPGGEVTRTVTGNGLTPGALNIVEANHDFTTLAVDATAKTHTFTVKNTGQVATGVPMPSITGTPNAYAIASTTCTAMLPAAATCNVVVKFDPSTVGSKPGSLVVTGTPGGSDSATLSGTGVAHVAVTKTGNGTGAVTSNMTGIDCGSGCAADFSATPVTLSAAPDTGMNFGGWTGDCSGTNVTCSLDLTAGKAVGAVFTKQRFTLTTSATGNGSGTITGGGTYDYSTTPITVTATPDVSSTFTGWGGDCLNMTTCTVTMTANHSVTAGFTKKQFTLTTSTTGSGTVSGGGTYDYSTTPVTITATPDTGWQFSKWGGDCAGTTPTCQVTMTANHSVTATFTKQQFTLTTSTNGTGTGTISGAGTYDYSTTPITITATPGSGSVFTSWGGDCAGVTTSTCQVTMTANHNVTATFTKQFTMTTSTTGLGSGSISGAGTYSYGQPAVLNATAAPGSSFTGWGGDCTGTTGPQCQIAMYANHTASANFELDQPLTVTAGTGGTVSSSPTGISCSGATCSHNFPYGQAVTLTANLDPGYQLGPVSGGGCTTLPCTVPMNQAQNVGVQFTQVKYKFSLSLLGDIQGNVTVTTPGGTTQYTASTSFPVTYGDQVTLTAMAGNADILFAGWGGACSTYGQTLKCIVNVTGDTSASATWLRTSYPYTVTAITQGPNGLPFDVNYEAATNQYADCQSTQSPGTTCSGNLRTLTQVNLVAHVPATGAAQLVWNTLPTWTGCDTVSADRLTCTITINGRRTVTATGDTRVGP